MNPFSWSAPNGVWCLLGAGSRFSLGGSDVVLALFSHPTLMLTVLTRHMTHSRHSPGAKQSIRPFLQITFTLLFSLHGLVISYEVLIFHPFLIPHLFNGMISPPSHRFKTLH